MALHLILRNSTKLSGVSLLKHIAPISAPILSPLTTKSNLPTRLFPGVNQWQVQSRQMSGDHSKIWPIEKALSAVLIGLVPAAIAVPNPVLDNLAAIVCVVHFHWGLEACAADYIRPIIFGNVAPKLAMALVYFVSAFTLGGLIYFNSNDVGIGKAVRKFWALKAK